MQVFNNDIAGLYSRINRYITELIKCASSNVADINEHDRARIGAYITALQFYINWSTSQPFLDLPETHPKTIELENAPEIPLIENLMVADLISLLVRGRDEIINSQSARNSNGIISFDLARINAVLTKIRSFLLEYVDKVTPVDMPESSPKYPDTGTGSTGIQPV